MACPRAHAAALIHPPSLPPPAPRLPGVNYTRTACVIAVSKAKDLFEPFLHQLGYRLAHVQRRMLPIAMHLLQVRGGGGAAGAGHWWRGWVGNKQAAACGGCGAAASEGGLSAPSVAGRFCKHLPHPPSARICLPAGPPSPQKDGQFLNGHDLFLKRVGAAYHAFIDEFEKGCRCGGGGARRAAVGAAGLLVLR